MRVVVDTDVWISGLILPDSGPGNVLAAVLEKRIEPVVSWELAEELIDVVRRPKLRRYEIDEDDVRDLLLLLAPDLPAVDLDVELRDPNDAPVVAAAVAGRAEAIVTGDDDLFDDAPVKWLHERGIEVLRPRELLNRLDS